MKKIIALASAFALCLVLGACSDGGQTSEGDQPSQEQTAVIDYKVADEQLAFSRNDDVGMAYRVTVSSSATEDELKAVFAKVIDGDGYNIHEVWFYSDERLTDGSAAYDVALVSVDAAEGEPVVTMATDEAKAAAKELLAQKSESGSETDASGAATDDAAAGVGSGEAAADGNEPVA